MAGRRGLEASHQSSRLNLFFESTFSQIDESAFCKLVNNTAPRYAFRGASIEKAVFDAYSIAEDACQLSIAIVVILYVL